MAAINLMAVTRKVSRPAVAALFMAGLFPAVAGAQQSAGLSVGARVAPHCTISVDRVAVLDADNSGVRVVCGKSALRALRISTDRGDILEAFTTLASAMRRAGGEVAVAVPQLLGTVASRLPVFAMPAQPERRPVLVTLDF
jgi:hypothetical protein